MALAAHHQVLCGYGCVALSSGVPGRAGVLRWDPQLGRILGLLDIGVVLLTACSMETTAVIGRNLDIVFLASASLLIVTIPFRDLSLLMSFIAERMNLVCFFASPAMVLVPPVVASC